MAPPSRPIVSLPLSLITSSGISPSHPLNTPKTTPPPGPSQPSKQNSTVTINLELVELIFPTPPISPRPFFDLLEDLPPRTANPPPPQPSFDIIEWFGSFRYRRHSQSMGELVIEQVAVRSGMDSKMAELTMSSPNRSTSDIEDAFSSMNILNYTSVSPNYFPASSGNSSFNSSENSTDNMIPLVFSSFYNNPCSKDVQAFYAKESPISSPDPITSPAILTPSLILPPSLY
ncbi:hypothetical protein Tco_1533796 [Tanacetum coccineum]